MRDIPTSVAAERELAAVLNQVRADFIRRIQSQIEQFRTIRTRIADSGGSADREFLRFEAHKICGIARTLGFWKLGDSAEHLETALTTGACPGGIPALLDHLLRDMAALCAVR